MHRNHPKFSSKNKALLKRKGVTTEVRSLGLVGTAKTSCCSVDTSQRFQSKEKHNQASLCLNCPEKLLKTAFPPLATADIWREGDETQLCSLSPTLISTPQYNPEGKFLTSVLLSDFSHVYEISLSTGSMLGLQEPTNFKHLSHAGLQDQALFQHYHARVRRSLEAP